MTNTSSPTAEMRTDVFSHTQPNSIIKQTRSALKSKNVRIHKRRTSIRLEPSMWSALNEIAGKEKCSVHDLCGAVHDTKDPGTSFTAALRSFMVEYYRAGQLASKAISMVQERISGQIRRAI